MNQMEQIAGDLALLAEKFMHIGVNPEHLAYCPTMDLLAIATLDQQVHVYRINGQRVFGLYNKENSKICGLAWKPNGQHMFRYSQSAIAAEICVRSTSRRGT